jgi:hypothetical protein
MKKKQLRTKPRLQLELEPEIYWLIAEEAELQNITKKELVMRLVVPELLERKKLREGNV